MNEIESNEGGRKELENIFEEAETTKEGRGLTLKELYGQRRPLVSFLFCDCKFSLLILQFFLMFQSLEKRAMLGQQQL